MPLVEVIFRALAAPTEPGDEQALRDRQLLQRAYFLFVAAIITNNVVEVVASQGASPSSVPSIKGLTRNESAV